MDYAVAIVDGPCGDIGQNAGGLDECLLPHEARVPDEEGNPLGAADGDFAMLEDAFCNGQLFEFCNDNPDLCGDVD